MNKKLLSLLACPICKGKLVLRKANLHCANCSQMYMVKHGVPVLVQLQHLPAHLQGQVRYFNKSAKSYGNLPLAQWQRKYIESLFDNMKTKKNKILVDDACGSGYVTVAAAQRGMQVLACDLNLSGLIKLYQYVKKVGLGDRILPVCCSADNLPIQSEVVDAIVANAILEHLPKEKEAIADITRIAKRGAIAIITVPLAYRLLHPLFLLVNYVQDKQVGHLRRYTKELLVKKFAAWKIEDVGYSGHTKKVFKTLWNLVIPMFDEEDIEKEDAQQSAKKIFASNVRVVFRRL